VGSHGTFVIGSLAFKLFAAIDLYSVNCGQVALYRSAGRVVEFVHEYWQKFGCCFEKRSGWNRSYQPYRWLRPWNKEVFGDLYIKQGSMSCYQTLPW